MRLPDLIARQEAIRISNPFKNTGVSKRTTTVFLLTPVFFISFSSTKSQEAGCIIL